MLSILQSYITWSCTQHDHDQDRTLSRLWTNKRCPNFKCLAFEWVPALVPGSIKDSLPPGCDIMTSSNENVFYVTGLLCKEFTSHQWIPLTKASEAELWCFLWSVPIWANNWDTDDLRRQDIHCDVTVMEFVDSESTCLYPHKIKKCPKS